MADPSDNPMLRYWMYEPDLGGDSVDLSTADVLARVRQPGVTDWMRSLAPNVVQADENSPVLSRIARTGTGLVHGGINTMADWFDAAGRAYRGEAYGSEAPGEGYSYAESGLSPSATVAPLGLAPMGGLVGHSAAALRPSLTDSARARYLEWAHPEHLPAVTGGRVGHESVNNSDALIARDAFAARFGSQGEPAIKDARYATSGEPYDAVHSIANERGTPRDRFRLLSDQSRASVPGTVINSLDRPERPVSAATRYGDRIFAAPVHGLELDQAYKALGEDVVNNMRGRDITLGFITSTGRFVSRDEAAELAARADPNWRPPKDSKYKGDSAYFMSEQDLAGLPASLRATIEGLREKNPQSVLKARNDTGSVPGTVVNAYEEDPENQMLRMLRQAYQAD